MGTNLNQSKAAAGMTVTKGRLIWRNAIAAFR